MKSRELSHWCPCTRVVPWCTLSVSGRLTGALFPLCNKKKWAFLILTGKGGGVHIVYPLPPCIMGSPIFTPMRPAQVVSKDPTPTGLVHNSTGDRVVCMGVQLNRCCVSVFLRRGQYGEVCVFALTICKYERFVLCLAMVRRVYMWCLKMVGVVVSIILLLID